MTILEDYSKIFRPAIENQLKQVVAQANNEGVEDLYHILAYHMGWEGPGAGPESTGKRIRPQLVLLVCAANGGDWQSALPAAAAVELLHNFSLLHDDIEDNSPQRRGRETVWSKWGVPLAINSGDTMFTLAFLSLQDITNVRIAGETTKVLLNTSLLLTQGQHLDISFETRNFLPEEEYWQMISGKTAALLSACCELGALVGGASLEARRAYVKFGKYLGLSFQAHDDFLGIWGDSDLTGKSAESDLVTAKKSLPVVFGLRANGQFAKRWAQGKITKDEVPAVAAMLENEGGKDFTKMQVSRLTGEALSALNLAEPQGESGNALRELAEILLKRSY